MVIGGLAIGVTPLDMAHAYETIANYGRLTIGHAGLGHLRGQPPGRQPEGLPVGGRARRCPSTCSGPVGIQSISRQQRPTGRQPHQHAAGPHATGADQTEVAMMHGVLTIGTAQAAQIPGLAAWGKTGTTSNYVDAWFVGSTPKDGKAPSMTVAVWVGYPNSAKSMAKDYGGKPGLRRHLPGADLEGVRRGGAALLQLRLDRHHREHAALDARLHAARAAAPPRRRARRPRRVHAARPGPARRPTTPSRPATTHPTRPRPRRRRRRHRHRRRRRHHRRRRRRRRRPPTTPPATPPSTSSSGGVVGARRRLRAVALSAARRSGCPAR